MVQEVISRLKTKLAYDAGVSKGPAVTIAPGTNTPSAADWDILDADQHFADHVKKGFLIVQDPAPKPKPVPVPPLADEAVKKPTLAAKVTGAQDQMVVDTYKSMPEANRTAFYATLTPEQKALIDALPKE
jgi:hypothetical protein